MKFSREMKNFSFGFSSEKVVGLSTNIKQENRNITVPVIKDHVIPFMSKKDTESTIVKAAAAAVSCAVLMAAKIKLKNHKKNH